MFDPIETIRKKRSGSELSTADIQGFINAVSDGSMADYQISALLMAICIRGMSKRETVDMTMAMAKSGDMMDLTDAKGIKVDKHSTGGVGDTTTLILAPLAAACGAVVAKMSGRGLGHTGGTLDKLESIPGFNVEQSQQEFIGQLNAIGCAVIGQSLNLVPADKVLYALRDVTGTVDSLPLIVSSILSKKIASGADAVVLDVKTGSGALMPTLKKSIELAQWMVDIGNMTGVKFMAMVTDMDQPLGMAIGNAMEVEEAIQVLRGELDGHLKDVSILLCAHMLWAAGLCESVECAKALAYEKLNDGSALQKLREMIAMQHGDARIVDNLDLLPRTERILPVLAEKCGYVSAMETDLIGNAAKVLGAGRERKEDHIDPAAGLLMKVRVGDRVDVGDVLCELHINGRGEVQAQAMMISAIAISDEKPSGRPLIYEIVTGSK